MSKVKILDCTLRDGGYINNWKFGEEAIQDIRVKYENIGVDIIELGFLRDVEDDKDVSIFSSPVQLERVVKKKNEKVKYAVMAEMACYYPYEKIVPRTESSFDMIRYTFWKRCLDEGFEYCKKIKEKGYDLAVQPTRVEQYSDDAFRDTAQRFGELEPYAFSIVDTFGLLTKDRLLKYAEIADKYLDNNIALGYHAHNNMQQALTNAIALTELQLDRDIVIDVSAFGMGRGAGNLNSELFLNYLNQKYRKQYDISQLYEIWDYWLKDIYDRNKWGYSYYYFISAYYGGNPNYAMYFADNHISVSEANRIMREIPYEERIIFSEDKVRKYLENKR